MISVLVLTRNEERDLPGCLRSVAWSDDIWVLDSISTDSTTEIAISVGAQVIQRPFDNWAAHQNWAVRNIPFRHPWVFYLDADERVTPELAAALRQAVTHTTHAAFEVERRDFLNGTWLRHVQMSAWYTRLFRPEAITYERLVNPVTQVDGTVGRITGYLDHFPFSKGVGWWLTRHNDYSTREAEQLLTERDNAGSPSLKAALFGGSFAERRRHQKMLFYRLPGRPLLKFIALYALKRGFLDGKAGLEYAVLQSIYEYMIVLKTRELDQGGPADIDGRVRKS